MFSIGAILLATKLLFLSDRASFWDSDHKSEKTEQMEEQSTQPLPVNFPQFKGKKVLFLVHGFNNTGEDAQKTYRLIRDQLTPLLDTDGHPLYDILIGYLWPGGDSRLAYFTAKKTTQELADRVGLHLHALTSVTSQLDIFAHSMGNRLILGALDTLSIYKNPVPKKTFWDHLQQLPDVIQKRLFHFSALHSQKPVENFYSIAAAVDDESIEKDHEYYNSTLQCQNMYVFHSNHDDVLKFLFLLAETDEALGLEGDPDPDSFASNIQFIDCTQFVDGHSGYFSAKPLYKFIQNQQANKTAAPSVAPTARLLADGLIQFK